MTDMSKATRKDRRNNTGCVPFGCDYGAHYGDCEYNVECSEPTDVHDVIPGEPCRWFAHCTLPATHMELHPIIGQVPACDRCTKIGR
jgi:hypothetical protein